MTTVADLVATAQPRTTTVRVCARGDLVDRHAELVAQLEGEAGSSVGVSSEAKQLAAEIVAVEEEQEASTLTVTLKSVSRRVWADLLAQHPPRPQDKGLDHNPDTFPTAAIAAASVEPALTVEDVDQLADVLPPAEWAKLWRATFKLNVAEVPHPKLAAASELARASGDS